MRKLLLVSLLLFVMYGMAYSDALLGIISPNGGEKWPLGSEKEIRWSADERLTNNVRLILFRNGTRIGLIAKNLKPRPGIYTWKKAGQYEGGMAKAGSGYKIVIREHGGTAIDKSDKPFYLTPGKKPPSIRPIKVTNPKKGDKWSEGETRIICWESVLKPPFKVELFSDSKVLVMECKPTTVNRPVLQGPHKHTLAWNVPELNDFFYIRVSKGAAFGFSGRFSIYDPPD
jgi:hypothetical protein